MIGGWMVASGQLDPDSIKSWTRNQIELSRGALVVMKRQLAEYEARGSVVNEWTRTTWTVEFERSGNDMRITNPELIMAPDVKEMRCDPGVLVQTR